MFGGGVGGGGVGGFWVGWSELFAYAPLIGAGRWELFAYARTETKTPKPYTLDPKLPKFP